VLKNIQKLYSQSLLLLIGLLFTGSLLADAETVPKYISLTDTTSFRDLPFFAKDQYLIGHLNPGVKAEIISLNQNHTYGVSFQVKILSGAQKGKVGWVYYSEGPKQRSFELLNEKNKSIKVPGVDSFATELDLHTSLPDSMNLSPKDLEITEEDFKGKESGFRKFFNEHAKTLDPSKTDGIYTDIDVPDRYKLIKSDEEIWEGALKGEYEIELDNYDGGKYIPFIKEESDRYGVKTRTRYYASMRPEYLARLPQEIQKTLAQIRADCEESDHNPVVQGKWLPHCETLGSNHLGAQNFDQLGKCLDSIKAAVTRGMSLSNLDRTTVFKNLYSELNPKEQEFAAMIFTSIGEAGVLAPPLEEMIMVMKVLSNRKDFALDKGYRDANELDAALQPWQFSMYNKGAHHWSSVIRQTNSSPQTINAIRSYIQFQNTDFPGDSEINRIHHYHTNYVNPDWRDDSKIVKVKLNGQDLKKSGTRHIFYRDIAWSCRNNNWSGK
jgi:hypothetical protein